MLHLNDIKIKGSDLKIAATLSLASEDISGESSSTAKAETGDKPKQLGVTLLIKYAKAADLSELVNLAEAKDDSGGRVAYDIVNDTADAMNIRRVIFNGDLSAREDESLKLWRVSFKLSEIKSVAEAKDDRQESQNVADQKPTGETTQPTDTEIQQVEDLTPFEKTLSRLEGFFN